MHRMQADRFCQIGSAVIWTACWIAAGMVLKGHPDEFAMMIPVLAVGSLMGLSSSRPHRAQTYLLSQAVLWTGILTASIIVLSGTPFLLPMSVVLVIAALWYLLVLPMVFFGGWTKHTPHRSG